MRREPYWALQSGDRPYLDEFSPHAKEVVIFRMRLPIENHSHINTQEMWDFANPETPLQRTQVIDPLAENAVREQDEDRMEAIRIELERIKRREIIRI